MLPAAVAFSVACVCGASLLALRWVLAHREKSFEHKPLAELQRELEALKTQILGRALNGR